MLIKTKLLSIILLLSCFFQAIATDYFVHPMLGNDANSGLSKNVPFKTLAKISNIKLLPGDRILLASNQVFNNGISLMNQNGEKNNPIVISTINWDETEPFIPALIDFKGEPNGILLQDCSFIEVSNLKLTANGYDVQDNSQDMRCGILIKNSSNALMEDIVIKKVFMHDIYFENAGFKRAAGEVKTANGTQKYGWGIRVMNNTEALINNVKITDCSINDVSHTGIKLTGKNKNITNVAIVNNNVEKTGGPGIQMSEVADVHVSENVVTHSGSDDDSRKWGRGSGLWTWGASKVLIEKNKFLYANGPGDSAGAHIDFNCDNVVLQYNISAHNAGGFIEILGNNYNCAYRYNISINDGHRVKGVNGAFQEGKVFWLSGYQGEKQPRKGPVNSYMYNNTIYSDSTIVAKFAVDNTSSGILIANNIFYIKGKSVSVLGDQFKADKKIDSQLKNVFFENNLFLNSENWPSDLGIKDNSPIFGNPMFVNEGGMHAEDYMPKNSRLVKNKGVKIDLLANDTIGLMQSLKLKKDILGNKIRKGPSLGAIEPKISNK